MRKMTNYGNEFFPINENETQYISSYLIELNKLGFTTYSSQPWSTLENKRGYRPYQLEYVAGLLDSSISEKLRFVLAKDHPNILWSTPELPICIPVGREIDGSVITRGWGGKMCKDTYLRTFSRKEINLMTCVELIHCDWTRHDDYLFKSLVGLLTTLKSL